MTTKPNGNISVVIPAFNAAAFIVDALDSVSRQTIKPHEILVINDGSRDETVSVVNQWIEHCKISCPVRLLSQENRGIAATRNRGIFEATGNLVALLDADDIWERNHLEVLLNSISLSADAVGAYGAGRLLSNGKLQERLYDEFWDNPSKQYGVPIEGSTCLKLGREIIPRLFKGNFIKPSSIILDRSVALEIGLFNEELRSAEDREFLIRLSMRGSLIYYPEPITQYRWHEDNLSQRKNAIKNAENGLLALKTVRDYSGSLLVASETDHLDDAIYEASKDYLAVCAHHGVGRFIDGLRNTLGWFGTLFTFKCVRLRSVLGALLVSTGVKKPLWG